MGIRRFIRGLKGLRSRIKVYKLVMKDKRTPKAAKVLLALAIGYTLMPFDLIPDFLPVIGHVDDLIIVPLLFYFAIRMIPKEVIEECERMVEGG
ncbi:MAG: hypothetical protein A2X99_07450 [Deltaproteobacteria bacterium GWB2_55_19]|nr:MAG: hypothetical protein A2X99_07445 [Deltaproteobacteria bacterium GWB2_55_19]OGP23369.1 MAG: hypothetical protein A2X99_07450 [Deltaproteobacteria bacterium GWB2_55_19]